MLGLEGVPALRGVSLKVNRGEWVVIYGTSGGGKTSLLNIIGTIDKPTKGELSVCKTVINANTKDSVLADLRLHKLGFVFQTFNLLSSMTARENVELPMTLKAVYNARQRKQLAKASLERVGLGHRMDHFPSQLSGGEQQRVTIARAIANSPELLLLDEPTGDLDSANTHKIVNLLHKLNTEQNMTLIMVTHDIYLKNFAHRIVWMRDGKVAKEEIIPQERREAALRDLENKLTQSSLKAQTHVHLQPTASVTTPKPGFQHTEIRHPKDYPTYSPRGTVDSVLYPNGKRKEDRKESTTIKIGAIQKTVERPLDSPSIMPAGLAIV